MTHPSAALLVGISGYSRASLPDLPSSEADVVELQTMLENNHDGSANFTVTPLIIDNSSPWGAGDLLRAVDLELDSTTDHFLFYFSGHGRSNKFGLQLATPDKQDSLDSGVFFDALLQRFNRPDVKEVTIILDCCFSGAAGDRSYVSAGEVLQFAHLREGISILASSRRHQESEGAIEGTSLFTKRIVERLSEQSPANVLDLYNFARAQAREDEDQDPVLRTFGSYHSPVRK